MKSEFLLPDLLALMEIVNEHTERNFPGGDPPRVLKKLQLKLGHLAGMYQITSSQPRGVSRSISGTPKTNSRQTSKKNKSPGKRDRDSQAAV